MEKKEELLERLVNEVAAQIKSIEMLIAKHNVDTLIIRNGNCRRNEKCIYDNY